MYNIDYPIFFKVSLKSLEKKTNDCVVNIEISNNNKNN